MMSGPAHDDHLMMLRSHRCKSPRNCFAPGADIDHGERDERDEPGSDDELISTQHFLFASYDYDILKIYDILNPSSNMRLCNKHM